MKDLQKIKEFFSKPMNEGNKEYFKPLIRKNKSNPNFLYVDILYPVGTGFTTALGSKTMLGQDKEEGAAKALAMGNIIAKKLKAKYDLEDIDVSDLENGKVEVFAVSDDFIKIDSPSLDEAKISHIVGGIPYKRTRKSKEDKIEIIQKLDEPTKIKLIKKFKEKNWEAKPNEKGGLTATKKLMSIPESNGFDKALDLRAEKVEIEDEINQLRMEMEDEGDESKANYYGRQLNKLEARLAKVKKQLDDYDMNESVGFKSGKEFINIKLQKYPKSITKVNQLINMIGESNFTMEMAEWIFDFFNNASYESPINESKSISDYKVGDILKFKDGEDWKVMKVKDNVNKLVIKPYNEKAKKGNVSLEIDVDLDYLKNNLNEAEAQEQSLYKDWDQFEKPSKIKVYLNNGKTLEINPLRLKGGKRVYDAILQAFIDDRFDITNKVIQGMTNNLSEAKEEDKVDTITMDIPLFLRMLEYSREDASQDMDLHDVTEKSNLLGKERGILSMEDYEEIVGAAEEIKENNGINYSKLIDLIKSADNPKNQPIYYNSDQGVINVGGVGYDKGNLIKVFNSEPGQSLDIKTLFYKANQSPEETKNAIESMDPSIKVEIGYGYGNEPFVKYIKSINEAELTEANVPSNIRDFAKRKGVSSLVNKVAGWAEKVGARIAGGTAVGMNYATLVLDLDYKQQGEIRINTDNETIKLYDEPVDNFNAFQRVYVDYKDLDENVAPNHKGRSGKYGSGYELLDEKIAKALDKINEELCPAGKAYRKRRIAAGEKSSAYLSGRAVKVCKGQISGKKKKK